MSEGIVIRSGKAAMDLNVIHEFLSTESYWAAGISRDLVERSLENSYCVGAFTGSGQVGFGRVITDYYTFGWFADFFVLPAHRKKGVSGKMLEHIFHETWAKRLRRMMLNTKDAHGLYRQFGFGPLSNPDCLMEIYSPNVHLNPDTGL